ncbi:hypothetical protein [cf. Phormidesmis sp. LEGE 11477]|uniref:hypothetical protein n=1 Tax=cf. Phormidesmis sp. LEGE 11477 TaxID=1828680 RepID=UPI00187FDFE1|nr:hypothetical protein [cf. Phormidesmis sp. LEGE 11477]MBE9064559.1 hypothetical protein [cf. Phormidesmis sp. LEGE 11477]
MKLATLLLLIGWLLSACTEPAATPAPPITDVLIRGTNFNGKGGIEIEGYRWTSQNDSKGNGLMLREVESATTELRPKPATDENTQAMLNSSIVNTERLAIDQLIYNAKYDMYFWFMENQRGTPRTMSIEIEGQIVEEAMGDLPYRQWARFGPYPVDLTDTELNIVITTTDPNQKAEVMGMLMVKP